MLILAPMGTAGELACNQSRIMSHHARSRSAALHQSRTLSIGVDVHKASMAGAYVAPAHHADVVALGTIGPRPCDLDQRMRQRQSKSTSLLFVSEAGPCGDGLSRSLPHTGHVCWVVAPSLSPTKPEERVTTHRRDAIQLARLRRSGALPPGDVLQGEEAALRALCRTRAAPSRALHAAQCQRPALLRRHALRSPGRAPWSPAHLGWLSAVVWPTPAQQLVCPAAVRAVTDHPARLARLAPALPAPGPPWRLAPVVAAHQARRGGPCTVAVTPVAARGALTRGRSPSTAEALPGLPPRGIRDGRAAPPGRPPPDGQPPGPPRPGRRRLGLARPRHHQPAAAMTPGEGAQAEPRAPLAGAATIRQTLQTVQRQREPCQPGWGRHRAGTAGVSVGHGPGGRANCLERDRSTCAIRWHGALPGHRPSRRPGVVSPAMACRGCNTPACLARGRPPTDARKGVATPRLAAGSTVVSSWLRLFRWTLSRG